MVAWGGGRELFDTSFGSEFMNSNSHSAPFQTKCVLLQAGTVTRLWAGRSGSIPGRAGIVILFATVSIPAEGPNPVSYAMSTGNSVPRNKAAGVWGWSLTFV
jgi:hypothetical protein